MTLDEQIAATVRTAFAEVVAEHVGPQVFNLEGAARYLATTTRTIHALIDAGDLPCVRIGDGYRIGRKQLDELLARGAVVTFREAV